MANQIQNTFLYLSWKMDTFVECNRLDDSEYHITKNKTQ